MAPIRTDLPGNLKRPLREGLSLIEVVVVIAIISITAGLVLAAIGRSRARARTVVCQNNMRQVALALVQFEHNKRRLPPVGDAQRGVSWVFDLLPYLEHQKLHNAWDFSKPAGDPANFALADTPLAELVCPVDETAAPGHGNLSYVVNAGFANFAIPYYDLEAHTVVGDRPGMMTADLMDLNGNGYFFASLDPDRPTDLDLMWNMGVFFLDNGSSAAKRYQSHSAATITDGLSSTIMLTENVHAGYRPAQVPGWPTWPTWASYSAIGSKSFIGSSYICADYSCAAGSVDYANANNRSDPAMTLQGINGSRHLPDPTSTYGYVPPWPSSFHGGGVNIALCDGSVRFLSERVAGTAYAKLITPAGGRLRGPLNQAPLSGDEF